MKNNALLFSLVLVVLVRLILAVTTPVFDTSEARYAAISANMARTGDFLVPHFTYHNEYQSFDGKPPLLFQLAGISTRVFGVNEFAVRLPGLLFATILLFLLYHVILVLSDKDKIAAKLTVVMTATCTAYIALIGFCMTDGLLVTAVSGAILSHAALVKSQNKNWSLLVFILLALGMLIKGPVALVEFGIPILIDLIVNRRWHILKLYRWTLGITLFTLIATPWFILMTRKNPDFLSYFFIHENLLRFLIKDYGDKYGAGRETFRGMSIIWSWIVLLPWSLFPKAYTCPWKTKEASAILGWGVIGITGFWCLTSRVPMAYLMPIVPLATTWCVLSVTSEARIKMVKLCPIAAIITTVALLIGILGGMVFSNKMQGAKAPYKPNRYSFEFYHGIHGIPSLEENKCVQ